MKLPGCFLLGAFACIVFINSCDDDKDPVNSPNNPNPPAGTDCSTIAKGFTDANGIIQARCATTVTCHGNGSSRGPGALVTYEQIFESRNEIRIAVINGSMPQNSSLSAAQKATIVCWIDAGASPN